MNESGIERRGTAGAPTMSLTSGPRSRDTISAGAPERRSAGAPERMTASGSGAAVARPSPSPSPHADPRPRRGRSLASLGAGLRAACLLVLFALGLLAGFSPAPAHAQTEQTVSSDWALIPAGVQPGESFRLLFVTSTTGNAISTDIATYNGRVQTRAANPNGHTAIQGFSAQFRALGSTASTNARANTLTRAIDPDAPIYWLDGAKVADNYAGFYDGTWGNMNVPRDETGQLLSGNIVVWTGTNNDGTTNSFSLGGTTGFGSRAIFARPLGTGFTTAPLNADHVARQTGTLRLYALSPVITVEAAAAEPTRSLSWSGHVAGFSETAANDGAVSGTFSVALTGGTWATTNNATMAAAITANGLPAGLSVEITSIISVGTTQVVRGQRHRDADRRHLGEPGGH